MLDRTIAPAFVKSQQVQIQEAERHSINNIPVHIVQAGTQKVIKIEFVFNAGKYFEKVDGAAYFTSNMLREGTGSHDSKTIAHHLDHFGAHLDLTSTLDFAKVGLYCLSKHFQVLFPMLLEIITDPVFPEKQLSLLKEIEMQQMKIDLKKSKVVAQRIFRKILFGDHSYGQSLDREHIEKLTPEHLREHFAGNYKNFEIFISGQFDEEQVFEILERNLNGSGKLILPGEPIDSQYKKLHLTKEIEGSLQSSLRLGFPFVGKHHQDFIPFQILNHLFGGYFGSRLMKNIREDKGYTYGIYSSVAPLQHGSYFTIATDVVKASADAALAEILTEINRLKEEEIPLDELDTVKNHISGSFQADITSPFALMDKYKSVYLHNLDYGYYKNYFEILEEITPDDLQVIANRYFKDDLLSSVKVG